MTTKSERRLKVMSERRLVSVIIPSYNRALSIEKSVNSVLNQTYKDLEVIVVDDGSTDNTKDILQGLSDERIRYVYQENAGACMARNNGLAHAQGSIIAFQDSDDVWACDKLEKQLEAMDKMNADVVCCHLRHERNHHTILLPKRIGNRFVLPTDDFFGIGTQTLLMKREVFEAEQFDTSFPRLQDLEWMIRVLQKYRVFCMSDALVDYYLGDDSLSVDGVKLYTALGLILRKHRNVVKQCPLVAMHAVKDLLQNRKSMFEGGITKGEYRSLLFKWMPNWIVYVHCYIQNVLILN